jgi:glucose-6-phosphate 1-dehydrogenase
VQLPEAYERLIIDAVHGDATLFIRRDEAEAAWSLISPILDSWTTNAEVPMRYEPGNLGASLRRRIDRARRTALAGAIDVWVTGCANELQI